MTGGPGRIVVVGAGLIGTSVAYALTAAGRRVWLVDREAARVRLAAELGAGEPWDDGVGVDAVEHVVVAVPPSATGEQLAESARRFRTATLSDTASVKAAPLRSAAAHGGELSRICGAHPVAGRERAGPSAARPDLFLSSAWVLCPTAQTTPRALADARAVALACGARPVEMSPEEHDRALAVTSHLPQLVASALAARLLDLAPGQTALAGPGLRDTTRIAASDPLLWSEVIEANAAPVAHVLADLLSDLAVVADALGTAGAGVAVSDIVRKGRAGHERLPGKHGAASGYAVVPVVVADVPGELARLLADATEAGVNVEDLTIEHAPGRPLGVVGLAVLPERSASLVRALQARGWSVHAG